MDGVTASRPKALAVKQGMKGAWEYLSAEPTLLAENLP